MAYIITPEHLKAIAGRTTALRGCVIIRFIRKNVLISV
jgi:hypothetical protein